MIIFKESASLRSYLDRQHSTGRTTGFVPTMGALHAGHLSLLETARAHSDCTICSIFVNPTQFNDPADFDKYPITIEKDIAALEAAGTDILFLPAVAEMYPQGLDNLEHYELGPLENILEGQYRPGHFQGVCQVMFRLLDKIRPHQVFMGQKDYQQCQVVARLIELTGLPTRLVTCPTVRETDGLAMSSRNVRLDATARAQAPAIYKALQYIQQHLQPGPVQPVIEAAKAILSQNDCVYDYVSIADAGNLQPVDKWDGKQKLVALVAAFLHQVRLIDNLQLSS